MASCSSCSFFPDCLAEALKKRLIVSHFHASLRFEHRKNFSRPPLSHAFSIFKEQDADRIILCAEQQTLQLAHPNRKYFPFRQLMLQCLDENAFPCHCYGGVTSTPTFQCWRPSSSSSAGGADTGPGHVCLSRGGVQSGTVSNGEFEVHQPVLSLQSRHPILLRLPSCTPLFHWSCSSFLPPDLVIWVPCED